MDSLIIPTHPPASPCPNAFPASNASSCCCCNLKQTKTSLHPVITKEVSIASTTRPDERKVRQSGADMAGQPSKCSSVKAGGSTIELLGDVWPKGDNDTRDRQPQPRRIHPTLEADYAAIATPLQQDKPCLSPVKMERSMGYLKEQELELELARFDAANMPPPSDTVSVPDSTTSPVPPSGRSSTRHATAKERQGGVAKDRFAEATRRHGGLGSGLEETSSTLSEDVTNELVAELVSLEEKYGASLPPPNAEPPRVVKRPLPRDDGIIEPDLNYRELAVDEGYVGENGDPSWLDTVTADILKRASCLTRQSHRFADTRHADAGDSSMKSRKLVRSTPRMRKRKDKRTTHTLLKASPSGPEATSVSVPVS